MSETGPEDFQTRLARINGGTAPVADNVYVPEKKVYVQKTRGQELRENARYPLSIVGAFVMGMLSVLIGRYARLHMMGVNSPDMAPDVSLMFDFAFAFAIAFIIRTLLDFKEPVHLAAKSMGITAMVATMHNAVHAFPGLFAATFSQAWVDGILLITEPNSIYFGGMSFLL